MNQYNLLFNLYLLVLVASCSGSAAAEQEAISLTESTNPFFEESDLPYGMPAFDQIKD